ncbi:MAG: hypothetical protein RL662_1666 [Bacteroidota bacterium]|jgi:isochorismate pyruvate lyase
MEITQCKSLDEVRANIDRIDSMLVDLIAKRSLYVNQAAKFKTNKQEVDAPQRVEQVIEKVKNLAEANNLNPSIAEDIFRTMIRGFIEQEKKALGHS